MTAFVLNPDQNLLVEQARALCQGESDPVANAANLASLCGHVWPDVSWVGFYWRYGAELRLGPFWGKPACTRIALGQGVCGTVAESGASLLVPNVHAFPGHIACDAATNSELVVPLLRDGQVWGVLDVDSTTPERFTAAEKQLAEELAAVYVASLPQAVFFGPDVSAD
nr:GAF domain-containing protein [Oceanococcus sp. HetDA_MAG_MS8]